MKINYEAPHYSDFPSLLFIFPNTRLLVNTCSEQLNGASCLSLDVRGEVQHPLKRTGSIIVLNILVFTRHDLGSPMITVLLLQSDNDPTLRRLLQLCLGLPHSAE